MELTTLSWMLIAADRAKEIGGGLLLLTFLLVVGVGFRLLLIWHEMGEGQKYGNSRLYPTQAVFLTVLLVGGFFLTLLVPSSTVILQVAAIELGDDVLNSDEFQRILDIYLPKEN